MLFRRVFDTIKKTRTGDRTISLKFCVFSDLHYKEGMYDTTVTDLRCILERAARSGAERILHAGDFCNDYPVSPEITELLRKSPKISDDRFKAI